MVFGNDRNFVVALVTLDPDAMAGWADENGMAGKSYADVVASEQVARAGRGATSSSSTPSSTAGRPSRSGRSSPHDLTIESGELTPSLKVKRNVVEANNKDLIDSFYG